MHVCIVCVPDVDYISLSCLFDWSYYFSYSMTMLLPVAVMLILALRHYALGLGVNQCVQKWLMFVVIVYNGLVTKIFQVFICIPLVDGTSMLKVSPDITVCTLMCMYMYACAYMCAGIGQCWTGGHSVLVGTSCLLGVVYIVRPCCSDMCKVQVY